jgi:DNA mismatch repair protein MutL
MTDEIRALPEAMIRQISAGEVIDSIAAVVRELIENALDAQATRLVIDVDPQQMGVTVADNGHGMRYHDLEQAARAHTTSKIRVPDDLSHIQTLGFRGEALHSLALLADLDIQSASQTTQDGWSARYTSDGTPIVLTPVAIASGTIVTVRHLFQNWPSRRASLPPLAKQIKAVQATIQAAALTHPWVTWQVKRQGQSWFNLWPGETAQALLPQIIPRLNDGDLYSHFGSLEESLSTLDAQIRDGSAIAQLELVMGLPNRIHRPRPDWVRVAINQRIVKIPELEQTILSAFARTLPRDRFPLVFAHFSLPSQFVDWNRHPAKTDVYLQHLTSWQQALEMSIQIGQQQGVEPMGTALHPRLTQVLKASEAAVSYRTATARVLSKSLEDRLAKNSAPTDALAPPQGLAALELRAIAQLHQMYIVVEHPAGVWLVEQHIAHERVLYEQLCDRWLTAPLPTPLILNGLNDAQQAQLLRIGVELEPFGDQTWAIRSAPAPLIEHPECAAALWELSRGSDLQAAQVATACRTAIRNGTELSLSAMQTLLNQWQRTAHPRTCPHGRPIYLVLEESALSRYFRRHWVVGKSHGLQP